MCCLFNSKFLLKQLQCESGEKFKMNQLGMRTKHSSLFGWKFCLLKEQKFTKMQLTKILFI
jgi:hypothetical protein